MQQNSKLTKEDISILKTLVEKANEYRNESKVLMKRTMVNTAKPLIYGIVESAKNQKTPVTENTFKTFGSTNSGRTQITDMKKDIANATKISNNRKNLTKNVKEVLEKATTDTKNDPTLKKEVEQISSNLKTSKFLKSKTLGNTLESGGGFIHYKDEVEALVNSMEGTKQSPLIDKIEQKKLIKAPYIDEVKLKQLNANVTTLESTIKTTLNELNAKLGIQQQPTPNKTKTQALQPTSSRINIQTQQITQQPFLYVQEVSGYAVSGFKLKDKSPEGSVTFTAGNKNAKAKFRDPQNNELKGNFLINNAFVGQKQQKFVICGIGTSSTPSLFKVKEEKENGEINTKKTVFNNNITISDRNGYSEFSPQFGFVTTMTKHQQAVTPQLTSASTTSISPQQSTSQTQRR